MARSYTGQRNYFAKMVNNSTDTATLAIGDELINDQRRYLVAQKPWWFLEKAFTASTVASTQFIPLAGHIERIISDPYVTIGTTRYTPKEAPSRHFWDILNQTTFTADIPEYWLYYAGQLGFYPTPATSSLTITVNAKQKLIDLSLADYTNGSITTVATSGTTTTITGSGVTWHAGMIGRKIRVTKADAANSGDGLWYEIATVPTSATLTLSRPYGGTAITAGSANYTIGEFSIVPDDYDSLPIYMALNIYFTSIDPNAEKAALYGGLATGLMKVMTNEQSNRTAGLVLDDGDERPLQNPNLFVRF